MIFKFELGDTLKDVVTGFSGVAMARAEYFTGCNHYALVSTSLKKDGVPQDWEWLDEVRLVKQNKKKLLRTDFKKKEKPEKLGGPSPNPPQY